MKQLLQLKILTLILEVPYEYLLNIINNIIPGRTHVKRIRFYILFSIKLS